MSLLFTCLRLNLTINWTSVRLTIRFAQSILLLPQAFNARISDFGLARAGPSGDKSHVSTQVIGTYGYAAPEYIATGNFHNLAILISIKILCRIMYCITVQL